MSAAVWTCELRARLAERKVLFLAAFFALSVLAAPGLLQKPPPHLLAAIQDWFGANARFGLFLYLWTDLAMNKAAVISGATLGSGVVVHEAARRSLGLWLSRPITPAGFYALRAGSAAAVAAGLYLGAQAVALPWFSHAIPDFRVIPFLLSGLVHVGVVVWSVLVSAAIAVACQRQLAGALLSVLLLFSLVGAAFVGVYNPAWAGFAAFNPFTQGIAVVSGLEHLGPGTVLVPVACLGVINLATLALGARLAGRIEP